MAKSESVEKWRAWVTSGIIAIAAYLGKNKIDSMDAKLDQLTAVLVTQALQAQDIQNLKADYMQFKGSVTTFMATSREGTKEEEITVDKLKKQN